MAILDMGLLSSAVELQVLVGHEDEAFLHQEKL